MLCRDLADIPNTLGMSFQEERVMFIFILQSLRYAWSGTSAGLEKPGAWIFKSELVNRMRTAAQEALQEDHKKELKQEQLDRETLVKNNEEMLARAANYRKGYISSHFEPPTKRKAAGECDEAHRKSRKVLDEVSSKAHQNRTWDLKRQLKLNEIKKRSLAISEDCSR